MSGMYDPADWKLTFSGLLITGFAAGTFIEVTHRTPAGTTIIGADGEGTFVISHDKSAQAKFTLRREATINIKLSNLLKLTRDGARAAIGPLLAENVRTKTTAKATHAMIVATPSLTAATDYTPIEWMLEAISLDMFHGAAEFSGVA